MFDAFADTFYKLTRRVLPKDRQGQCEELTKIHKNLQESVAYMREICSDSCLGVAKGKRVQRQVRYERLKDEFLSLIKRLTRNGVDRDRSEEPLGGGERAEFQHKIALYKD